MSKIRESIVSNCEKRFVLKALNESKRLDRRDFNAFRELNIKLGKDWGCCYVSLGETQVLAQVSCEVQEPKSSRPSEGLLYINLELNPLGAPHFEPGRQSELSVGLNRLLEKCLKDSKAIDLESLCIKVNEKVWAFRIDVNILNHEGNILDAASVAALCALAHFRRPDVTCDGEEVIVHSYAQRDPIPTVIHHYPICISFAIFDNGNAVLADPNLLEESVAEAHCTVGLNAYKELCVLHLGGNALTSADLILSITVKAASRAGYIIKEIKRHIDDDSNKRFQKNEVGFYHSMHKIDEDFESVKESLDEYLDMWSVAKKGKRKQKRKDTGMDVDVINEAGGTVEALGKGSVVLLPKESGDEKSNWKISSEEESESEPAFNTSTHTQKEQEISNKYDECIEELLYKDKQNFSVNYCGTWYPYIQDLPTNKYCLICNITLGAKFQKHIKSYVHYQKINNTKVLDNLKRFHDMWMSQPLDIQRQQIFFRKRKKKITCVLCSTFVLYHQDSLEKHLYSEMHKMYISKVDANNVSQSKIKQTDNANGSPSEALHIDSSESEEESVIVLNANQQTSKKKKPYTG